MPRGIFDFSPRGWGRVLWWTVLGTLFCVAVAIYVDSFNFPGMTPDRLTHALLVNTLVPTGLAVPMLLFFTMKLRELAIAHHELAKYASTDALTSVLNRGAFTTLVEGYLAQVRQSEGGPRGALLLVDADNFKSINDSYGHDRGDDALRIIAGSIKEALRETDLVGRIGGEEFAIFLPGSDRPRAESAAERVRRTIAEAVFMPDGSIRRLSVSVGGAVFERPMPLIELFRTADQQLYAAKRGGRNRVSVAEAAAMGPMPHAA